MRRLSMRGKHGKSEKSETTSDGELEANGVARLSVTNENNEMKKDKENENIESSRRSAGKKRTSRGRHSLKEASKDLIGKSDVEDTQVTESEEENKNVGRPGPSKRFKKDEKTSAIEKEYEVLKIVGQRTIKGRRQFLIRWKGYDEDSDTWEQEKDLNCTELIEEYLAENAENEEEIKPKKAENSLKSPGKSKSPKIDKRNKKAMKTIVKKAENGKQITPSDEEKDDKDNQKEFEVEKIIEVHFKKNKTREFLIRWKGFTPADDTWEPEKNLNCPELIAKFMQKVEKAKNTEARELRTNRPHTKRYTLTTHEPGRRLSRRNMDKQRATYHECDE
ncbi:chromobox protein homolog 5-like [Ceratina calcarata]|uniref:Chromobox protein homolog 5-like n=1 Tax=Ceratina calcarata TaxID=156304 RepID=A0AAJ7J6D6_9HYME|nr:chromobox protein homolog 5-like [Ceratina calcarata]